MVEKISNRLFPFMVVVFGSVLAVVCAAENDPSGADEPPESTANSAVASKPHRLIAASTNVVQAAVTSEALASTEGQDLADESFFVDNEAPESAQSEVENVEENWRLLTGPEYDQVRYKLVEQLSNAEGAPSGWKAGWKAVPRRETQAELVDEPTTLIEEPSEVVAEKAEEPVAAERPIVTPSDELANHLDESPAIIPESPTPPVELTPEEVAAEPVPSTDNESVADQAFPQTQPESQPENEEPNPFDVALASVERKFAPVSPFELYLASQTEHASHAETAASTQQTQLVSSTESVVPTRRSDVTTAAENVSTQQVPPAPPVEDDNSKQQTASAPPAPFEAQVTPWSGGYGQACCPRFGHNCGPYGCARHSDDVDWDEAPLVPWEALAHGEYIGPVRLPDVPEYRLRVDDVIEFVYRLTGEVSAMPYRLNVGDKIQIEFLTTEKMNRTLLIQPDGTITLPEVGQVPAAGRSIDELKKDLVSRFSKIINDPSITVTPTELNTTLSELRATVDSRFGAGGQSRQARVTPEGTIQLVAIGSVPAQGLTLAELKEEIEARYARLVNGIEVTPILGPSALRFVYVTGEVANPGRFTLEAPTTVSQAIAMAGSWNVGADLKRVVVFRRDENWNLVATQLNLKSSLFKPRPCPADEIFLRDSDIVIVAKCPVLMADNFAQLLFTDLLYRVIPISATVNYNRGSTIP